MTEPKLSSAEILKRESRHLRGTIAAELRNTPAVCRKSYINPAIFDSWRSGSIHEKIDGKLAAASPRKAETLVLAFLRQEGSNGRTTASSGYPTKAYKVG